MGVERFKPYFENLYSVHLFSKRSNYKSNPNDRSKSYKARFCQNRIF